MVAGPGDQAAGATGMGIVRRPAQSAQRSALPELFLQRPIVQRSIRRATAYFLPCRSRTLACYGRDAGSGTFVALVSRSVSAAVHASMLRMPTTPRRRGGGTSLPAADGLLWTPYLMGERTPHLDPNARGALVGITASHTRAHIIRAILEGVAFSLQDTFTIFREMSVPVKQFASEAAGRDRLVAPDSSRCVRPRSGIGGGGRGAAYGAAILAGVGARMWPSADSACEAVVESPPFSPTAAAVSAMNKQLCGVPARLSCDSIDFRVNIYFLKLRWRLTYMKSNGNITTQARNINSLSDCGPSETAAAIHLAILCARKYRPRILLRMLADVGAWGVNLHDNDLVPIDATAAQRDRIVRSFKSLRDGTKL